MLGNTALDWCVFRRKAPILWAFKQKALDVWVFKQKALDLWIFKQNPPAPGPEGDMLAPWASRVQKSRRVWLKRALWSPCWCKVPVAFGLNGPSQTQSPIQFGLKRREHGKTRRCSSIVDSLKQTLRDFSQKCHTWCPKSHTVCFKAICLLKKPVLLRQKSKIHTASP